MNENDAFAVVHTSEASASIVSVAGEIDMLTAPRLRDALVHAIEQLRRSPLIVDLSAVTFLSSGGLALLVEAHTLAAEHAVELRVVTGTSRLVVHPMEITGITELMPTFPDLEAAIGRPDGGLATG